MTEGYSNFTHHVATRIAPTGGGMLGLEHRPVGIRSRWSVLALAVVIAAVFSLTSWSKAPSAGAAPAKGTPIVLMSIAPSNNATANFPEMPASAKAAALAINKAGGVGPNHQPISILYCNDAFDTNLGAACARQAVAKHVVALVGGYLSACTGELPILDTAMIPVVASWPCGSDLQDPMNWPLWAGILGGYAGTPFAAKAAHKSSVAILEAASGALDSFVKLGSKAAGVNFLGDVLVPANATDYAPYVAKAQQLGAQSIIFGVSATQGAQFIRASAQLGYKPAFLWPDGLISAGALKALGSLADGNLFVGPAPAASANNPVARRYLSQLSAAESAGVIPKSTPIAATGVEAWLAVNAFALLVKNLPTITSATVLTALQAGPTINVGLVPPWTPSAKFPRIGSPNVFINTWKNGKFTVYQKQPASLAAAGF